MSALTLGIQVGIVPIMKALEADGLLTYVALACTPLLLCVVLLKIRR